MSDDNKPKAQAPIDVDGTAKTEAEEQFDDNVDGARSWLAIIEELWKAFIK